MRTVTIGKADEFDQVISDQGNVKQMEACLGYICLWAHHSPRYKFLTVWLDTRGNINATYRETDRGPVTYDMAGIMHDDGSYSTHS